jgi:hypothetical protein
MSGMAYELRLHGLWLCRASSIVAYEQLISRTTTSEIVSRKITTNCYAKTQASKYWYRLLNKI